MRRQIEIRCPDLSDRRTEKPMIVLGLTGADLVEITQKTNLFCKALANEEPKCLVLWNFEESEQRNRVWPDSDVERMPLGSFRGERSQSNRLPVGKQHSELKAQSRGVI